MRFPRRGPVGRIGGVPRRWVPHFETPAPVEPPSITRKPPLELDVEVETPDGTFRLLSDSSKASKRAQGISFGTQRGDGFTTGGFSLSRPIFKNYPDLNLLDTLRFIGKNGEVAYEGRHHSNPRANNPEQINVALVGWMTYLKGRKIAPLIIDRRLDQWGEASTQRKANELVGLRRFEGAMSTAGQTAGATGPAIIFEFNRFDGVYTEAGEAWFDAAGEDIGYLRYDFSPLGGEGVDATWGDVAYLSSDDLGTSTDPGTDHNQTAAANQSVTASTTGRKYAVVQSIYNGVTTGDARVVHGWITPRVIGNHGLTLREEGTQASEGYYLTDIVEYLLRTYYPKVNWEGQTNTFVVTQGAWQDSPADGFSIFEQLNNLALWETSMWENRSFHFEQADLTTYDWQFKTTDPGVEVTFEGDSIELFANGVVVDYTDVLTGRKKTLYPSDHEELRDDSESNPYNRQGEAGWTDTPVPNPCTEAEALQYGRAYLAEYNRPRRPGTYRLSGGYIRDYAGHLQQAWRVRSSETVGILDHPEDFPRLITATQWDQDSLTLTISVDAPDKNLTAIVARQELARTSRNL